MYKFLTFRITWDNHGPSWGYLFMPVDLKRYKKTYLGISLLVQISRRQICLGVSWVWPIPCPNISGSAKCSTLFSEMQPELFAQPNRSSSAGIFVVPWRHCPFWRPRRVRRSQGLGGGGTYVTQNRIDHPGYLAVQLRHTSHQ